MTVIKQERLVVQKQIPIIRVRASPLEDKYSFQELKEGHIKKDPFSLPPLRDVYEPLIGRETVRFSPFDGEIFVLGQGNEQSQIVIDNLDPKKESFWLNFSRLDDAYSASKKFYLDQGKSAVVNNTEEIIFSAIDNFPQFFEGNLNEKAVTNIINNICSNLVAKEKIIDGENQEYIYHALHNYRGIRTGHYSEQEERSRLGAVVLDIVNDLIRQKGIEDQQEYSPTLAVLLVEQQIERRFLQSLEKDFTNSITEQLHSHDDDLLELKTRLLESFKKYFGFPIFRCDPIKQSAEEIKKTILIINKIIDDFGDWNAVEAMNEVKKLIKK
ncbi:MAG: hypothetical protein V1803_00550 [Candidatus Roizmanbacteria bacterium]